MVGMYGESINMDAFIEKYGDQLISGLFQFGTNGTAEEDYYMYHGGLHEWSHATQSASETEK